MGEVEPKNRTTAEEQNISRGAEGSTGIEQQAEMGKGITKSLDEHQERDSSFCSHSKNKEEGQNINREASPAEPKQMYRGRGGGLH